MDTSYATFIETMVPQQELIVSRTNLSGIITYVNDTFATISGYEVDELIGKTHSIVRHPDMPKSIFGDLWQTLKRGDGWQGIIKNKRKDDGYYWVYAIFQVSTKKENWWSINLCAHLLTDKQRLKCKIIMMTCAKEKKKVRA